MANTQKTILVIEDEAPLLHAMADKLSREDFSVLQASDGQAGLETALDQHPDLILLDLLLPTLSGLEVMKRLRDDVWGKTVPIILLTNVNPDDTQVLQSVADNDPAYYLVKSDWPLQSVIDKIKGILHLPA